MGSTISTPEPLVEHPNSPRALGDGWSWWNPSNWADSVVKYPWVHGLHLGKGKTHGSNISNLYGWKSCQLRLIEGTWPESQPTPQLWAHLQHQVAGKATCVATRCRHLGWWVLTWSPPTFEQHQSGVNHQLRVIPTLKNWANSINFARKWLVTREILLTMDSDHFVARPPWKLGSVAKKWFKIGIFHGSVWVLDDSSAYNQGFCRLPHVRSIIFMVTSASGVAFIKMKLWSDRGQSQPPFDCISMNFGGSSNLVKCGHPSLAGKSSIRGLLPFFMLGN